MVDETSNDVFTFNLTGFLPNSEVLLEVFHTPENARTFSGWIGINGNGESTTSLGFGASQPGQYFVVANNPECPNNDQYIATAVFIFD